MPWRRIGRGRRKAAFTIPNFSSRFLSQAKDEPATATATAATATASSVALQKTHSVISQSHSVISQSPQPPNHRILYLAASAGLLSATAAGAFVLAEDEVKQKVEKELKKSFERLEGARTAVAERATAMYRRCVETGVAAAVLIKFLRSMMSSANEEAKLGLKMRVAALLADLSGANESRRRAIVAAGGGAVVDWLLDSISSASTPAVTQAEAARALSHLISDAATCDAVLARPHAIPRLFRFIYSIHPQSANKPKRTKPLHDRGEVLKGKSMLVAAIMDIVTSSCEKTKMEVFRPRLPECADSRDIAAALQVIEEGGLELDEPHDGDDDDDDDRKGMRGIGIKVLGGTAVIGALRFHDFSMLYLPLLGCCNMLTLPHLNFSHSYLSFKHPYNHNSARNLSGKGGSNCVSMATGSTRPVGLSENFDHPGLWDDLQSRHVVVPLAAWALSSWSLASSSNRFKIAELDRDGHALMTALVAPERTVKWHGALIARLLMDDKSVPVVDFGAEWSSSLLAMAFQACNVQDIPLVHVALSSLSVTIERSINAQKEVMDKGLQLMRKITKQTEKDQNIQEILAKVLELLWRTGSHLSLEESIQWSGILLRWVCGRHSTEGTRSSAANVLACVLEDHGSDTVVISQAWLTLLLTELLSLCKTSSPKKTSSSSKSTDVKASSILQNQIIQSAVQATAQLAGIVTYTALREGIATVDISESRPLDDLLTLDVFSEHMKPKKKDRPPQIDVADAALATLKGIKALTELCSENQTYQKRIIESGGLNLLRRLILSDDYEQLAATEVYDASRLFEAQDKVTTPGDKSVNPETNNSSSVRVPPTAHIRKHAARLLTILSLQSEASKVISEDFVWCKWLEDCANGKISGCTEPKIRSYARATLLNLSNTNCNGNNSSFDSEQTTQMDIQRNICHRYEDMIFLINPEASFYKCQTFRNWSIRHNSAVYMTNAECSAHTANELESINQGIDSFDDDSKSSILSNIHPDTFQEIHQELGPFLDVVFVHGFCGGPFKTWRVADNKSSTRSKSGLVEKIDEESGREGTCWPQEWLAADLPQTRLLTVKYKTNLSQWSGATLPLEEVSLMLLKKLVAAGIGDRPVVFITHSMGGLVVKQMLYQAGKQNLMKLVNNTNGIVFYSCPHFGSKLADMPWRIGLVLRPAPTIGELRSGSPRLEELNRFVRQLHNRSGLQVLSFSETKVTPLVEGYGGWAFRMEVVPIESAYPGFGELVVLDGTDHINSCKPISRTDPAYTEVLHFLQKLQKSM